jgi:hypothetical protein
VTLKGEADEQTPGWKQAALYLDRVAKDGALVELEREAIGGGQTTELDVPRRVLRCVVEQSALDSQT